MLEIDLGVEIDRAFSGSVVNDVEVLIEPRRPGFRFHHAVTPYPGGGGTPVIYGGLQRSQEAAGELIQRELMEAQKNGNTDAVRRWKRAEILFFNPGDHFIPWGTGGEELVHAVDDEAHGSGFLRHYYKSLVWPDSVVF